MPSRSRRFLLSILFLIVVATVGLSAARLAYFAFTPAKPGTSATAMLEIVKGDTPSEITSLLMEKGVIASGKEFLWLGKLTRQWKKIKAGEYKVSPGMNPMEIFSVLASGISVIHPVTVREGENMYEIAEDLEAKGLASAELALELCRNEGFIRSLAFQGDPPPTLEGYLFPDTYYFNKTLTAQDMLKQMVRHFNQVWTGEEEGRARAIGMTRHEAVTLASMVEKETGAPEERPLISSVFHNRLKKKMRLQSDPTTIYGIWENYNGNLRRVDLQSKNDYNTYTIPALPIGPISNPGKEAIRAALYPAESDYIFFVSHNNGTHEFTRSLNEHNRAVHKFQVDPKAREGKSWRDLKKRTGLPKVVGE